MATGSSRRIRVNVKGVSTGDDPERLLAEALRAQAAQKTPATQPPAEPDEPTERTELDPAAVSGYGLLSGGQHLGYTQPEDTEQVDPARGRAGQTATLRPQRRVGVGWILLLAIALGLAAGAVVGLVTLL